MSIAAFNRPFNRTVVTVPGQGIRCVCRAFAGYRLTSGSRVLYRCPACATGYTAPEWQAEALPHIAKQHEENVYGSYKELRQRLTKVTPTELGEMFILFKSRIEQLEARYQNELAGRRTA